MVKEFVIYFVVILLIFVAGTKTGLAGRGVPVGFGTTWLDIFAYLPYMILLSVICAGLLIILFRLI